MTINLPPEHELLIAKAMETGAYHDPEEVVQGALEMLHSENEWLIRQYKEIEEKIDRAFEQFEQGEFYTAEESRADMGRRKAMRR
jgi:Arc/MetJ-type ribon-helix-helix transcriptional regulator